MKKKVPGNTFALEITEHLVSILVAGLTDCRVLARQPRWLAPETF